MDVTLTDAVIRLDRLEETDAEELVAGEDDAMVRFLSGGRSTVAGTREYIAGTRRSWAHGGPHLAFAIRMVAGGAFAGTVDARLIEPYLTPGQANVSYGVVPRWRGQGVAGRAVRLLAEWLRERADVVEAVIRADPLNPASGAVARGAGFSFRRHTTDEHGDLDWFVLDLRRRTPGVSVVFVCEDDAGRILLARRGAGARDEPGAWDCGAGALEFGESFEEAVAREVREEYVAAPREVELCGVRNVVRADPPSHWVAVVFRARVDPAAVAIGEPHKFDELGWFRPDELPTPLHSQLAATLELAAPKAGHPF